MPTKFLSATAALSVGVWRTAAGGGGSVTTIPGPGDIADLDGFTLTADQDWSFGSLIGVTGAFLVSGNRTLTGTIGSVLSGFQLALTAAQTVNIVGDVLAGITANRIVVNHGSAILNLTGNGTGGTAANIRAVSGVLGTINWTGNALGGANTDAQGLLVNGATVNLVGDGIGGSTLNVGGSAVRVQLGTLNWTGTARGGIAASNSINGNFGIVQTGGTVNHTGSIIDTAGGANGRAAPGGTYNWTPTAGHTATIGGRTINTNNRSRKLESGF